MLKVIGGTLGAIILAGLASTTPSLAQTEKAGALLPDRLQVGDRSLHLAACGVRDTLWVEHFVAALYLPAGDSPARMLLDDSRPKAVRIEIVNPDWLPERKPEKWREPLRRTLSPASYEALRRNYGDFAAGDVLLATYGPEAGLTVSREGEVLMTESSHRPIEALLDAWADDDDPPAEKARRLIEENPC